MKAKLAFFIGIVPMICFVGCASHWSIVRDKPVEQQNVKAGRQVGKVAYVMATERAKSAANYLEALTQSLKQSGAFADVKPFDGITPIELGDVLVRASASDQLLSQRGEGQTMFDWRLWTTVGASTGWLIYAVESHWVSSKYHFDEVAPVFSIYMLGFLFFPSNYAYVNDSYPSVRFYETAIYRADGAKLASYASKQSARLERQLFAGGDEGNQAIDKELGEIAGRDMVSQFVHDQTTVEAVASQQSTLKNLYQTDVYRMMNFQLALETIRNESLQVNALLQSEAQNREREIQSTRQLHDKIASGLQGIAQSLQAQSAATAGSGGGGSGAGPMTDAKMQAMAKACESSDDYRRFADQARDRMNLSASYCAAAALAQCYIEHGLYGGTTGITLEQLQRMRDQNRQLASKYNNNCR